MEYPHDPVPDIGIKIQEAKKADESACAIQDFYSLNPYSAELLSDF